ncbi:hypothetical protein ACSMXN_22140 [Jatrophihabitans sp. DSM 45814]
MHDRLVSVCFSLLLGAAALYVAVRLIEAIWSALLVIFGVSLFIVAAVVIVRARSDSRKW